MSIQFLPSKEKLDISMRPYDLERDEAGYFSPMPWTGLTQRQQKLCDNIEIPGVNTTRSAFPPLCAEETEEARIQRLLDVYQKFTLELHTGQYLMHLSTDFQYNEIHCQLTEDLRTLKIDQSDGNIIEFPLTAVSQLRRLVTSGRKWYGVGVFTEEHMPIDIEHVVIVEFIQHKLPFVFKDNNEAHRFQICMELLIRSAQQNDHETFRTLTNNIRWQGMKQNPDEELFNSIVSRKLCGLGSTNSIPW